MRLFCCSSLVSHSVVFLVLFEAPWKSKNLIKFPPYATPRSLSSSGHALNERNVVALQQNLLHSSRQPLSHTESTFLTYPQWSPCLGIVGLGNLLDLDSVVDLGNQVRRNLVPSFLVVSLTTRFMNSSNPYHTLAVYSLEIDGQHTRIVPTIRIDNCSYSQIWTVVRCCRRRKRKLIGGKRTRRPPPPPLPVIVECLGGVGD